MKLYFTIPLDPDLASRLVAEQHAVCEQLTASLAMQIAALDNRDQTDRDDVPAMARAFHFQRMVIELRLEHTRAATAWLDRVAAWRADSSNRPSR